MKKIISIAIAAAFAIGFMGGVALAEEQKAAEAPKVVYGKTAGSIAEPVKVKDLEGKEYDTGEIIKKGNAFFLIFNSVCNICQAELRDLERNFDAISSKAQMFLVIVDMNPDRAKTKYGAYAEKFTLLHDPEFLIGNGANLSSTPSTLILEKGGKILLAKSGYKKEFIKEYVEILK